MHTAAELLANSLKERGVRHAFGVSGGAISFFWSALGAAGVDVTHFRQESGAAFAACEASIATGEPVVVFVTSGPGLTNVLTGIYAARHEAARVVLVSAHTDAAMQGRHSIQETGPRTFPQEGIFTSGAWFDYATMVSRPEQVLDALAELDALATRPTGFVAHISLSLSVQRLQAPAGDSVSPVTPGPHDAEVALPGQAHEVYSLLRDKSWAIWVGGGARASARPVRRLVDLAGVPTMATPRGKGVVAETDPHYLGVTGFAGHSSVLEFLQHSRPEYMLVLGTGMGDFASGYHVGYAPQTAFIHVDLDNSVLRAAYPTIATVPVVAELGAFCEELARLIEDDQAVSRVAGAIASPFEQKQARSAGRLVDPRYLIEVIQTVLVDRGVPVMAETGNGLAWAVNGLRISDPTQWRAPSGLVGAMGHFAAGVVGAALATSRTWAAIVGDGSMLMNNEISTAVHRAAPAIWVVLNDARYNMCEQGAEVLGLTNVDCSMPETDFAAAAIALGARGLLVDRAEDLSLALRSAVDVGGPVVVDVRIDPLPPAPTAGRNAGLLRASAPEGVH
ncbi:thiamine pyrophosphate-binding protein [Kribbella ginsengisoli]